jgi:diguanylate cyclase (GGDEF)-like protein
VDQAIAMFQRNPDARVLPVVDDTGRPIGIICDSDFKIPRQLDSVQTTFEAPQSTVLLVSLLRRCPVVEASAPARTLLRAYSTTENSSGVLLVENGRFAGFLDPGSILRLLNAGNLIDARDQNQLTKLPGDGFIHEFVTRAVQERETDWILIRFNFENFKNFNDTFGFQQGDRAIVIFADRLKRWYPGDSVMLGHGGGDSFTVGLRAQDVASATTATYALRRAFEQDASGFLNMQERADAPTSAPALTCRAAMLLLKSGHPIRDHENAWRLLSDLDKRAKSEGGFAFDRVG